MYVYRILNKTNGKSYIGVTTGSLAKRWREHVFCAFTANDPRPLYRAMRKYGQHRFAMSLVYEASSEQEMLTCERGLIAQYGTLACAHGYNLTAGGEGRVLPECMPRGEGCSVSKLTDAVVIYIRSDEAKQITNGALCLLVAEKFGIEVSRDCLRDARRGDSWNHLDKKYPPVKIGQGGRYSDKRKAVAETQHQRLAHYHGAAVEKSANMRRGKRGLNARMPEETVREIFYSPLHASKAAALYGVDRHTISAIRARRQHCYLTKMLPAPDASVVEERKTWRKSWATDASSIFGVEK